MDSRHRSRDPTAGSLPAVDPSARDRWWEPFRQVGGARVFHVDLTPHAAHEAAAFASLDAAERSRRQRFQHSPARRHFVLCRAALRSLLCEHLGCGNEQLSFGAAKHGKPFALVGARPVPTAFNISHSGQNGLIALAPAGRIGVDAEEYEQHRKLDELIEAVFGPNERAELAALTGGEMVRLFFRLWTLKEAVAKALGTGLSFDVSRFEIPPALRSGAQGGVFRIPQVSDVQWRLTDISDDRFAAALAHEIGEGRR